MRAVVDRSVLLVGSLPCRTAQAAMECCARELAGYARRIPDGETHGWINFSIASLARAEGVERNQVAGDIDAPAYASPDEITAQYEIMRRRGADQPRLRVRAGLRPEDVRFAPPGYDQIALRSYRIFKELQLARRIPAGARFQISLPTPFATLASAFEPQYIEPLLPAFESVLLQEVTTIARAIPAQDLAVQWDVAVEVIVALEGLVPTIAARFPCERLAAVLARSCDRVPADVQMGVHLCYGNPGGRHIIEPTDTGRLVQFANDLCRQARRKPDWLHMPVPIARSDDAYFAPLDRLQLSAGTELYLGLVHLADGLAGAERRLAAAHRHVAHFGVATECGMRFVEPGRLTELLALHRAIADANVRMGAES